MLKKVSGVALSNCNKKLLNVYLNKTILDIYFEKILWINKKIP